MYICHYLHIKFYYKMNISLFFAVAISLNFSVRFYSNKVEYQDFFAFDAGNDSVHLFRNNNTITMIYYENAESSVYQLTTDTRSWLFTWPTIINGKNMTLTSGYHARWSPKVYDSYLFIDPVLDDDPINEDDADECAGLLYGYFGLCLPLVYLLVRVLQPLRSDWNSHVSSRDTTV